MERFIYVVILACFSACATISPAAQKIQVHSQMSSLLDGCEKLGPVRGEAKVGWDWEGAYAAAKNNVREEAAKLGADSVVILNSDKLSSSVSTQGVAFRCYKQ